LNGLKGSSDVRNWNRD